MSMGSRKVNTEGIDEELLIASIGRRKQDGTLYRAQEPPVPAPEEESVPETEPPPTASPSREKVQKDIARRKRQEDDYSGLFLRRNEIKTRQCVYISRDVHSKILKIVNDIAGREISVGGYVDTVLRQHLEQHKEKINELSREGKMAYVRPEYHDRIMRITRVIGHDRLSLSAYIDHVLTHHFNQCEEAIKSLYARNYDAVF